MRVIMNALQSANRSGTGRYICELAGALETFSREVEMHYLCPDGLVRPYPQALEAFHNNTLSPVNRFLREQWAMPRTARGLGFHLLHYPSGTGLLQGGTPHVVTVHDLCYLKHPEWFPKSRVYYYRLLMGRNLARARRIIADSRATAADLMYFLGIPEEHIDVIPLGVSEYFNPIPEDGQARARAKYSLPEHFYLYVGTLEPRKNLHMLVRAWSRLHRDLPDLVIAGRTGWHTDTRMLQDLAAENMARIHFPGHILQEDLPALYSAADAFVYPSLMEGFGLPPLEAMACGTPVITSSTSSLPEVAGDAALLVSPEHEEEMTDALKVIVEDRELRSVLEVKGKDRSSQFTWHNTARKTLETYQKALAR